jgi:hypothetical protein
MSSCRAAAKTAGVAILGVVLVSGTGVHAAEPNFLGGISVATGVNLPDEARTGDLDGDGDLDLAIAIRSDNDVFVYLNTNGDASAWSAIQVDNNLVGAKSVVPADLDGDGDLDLVAAAQTGNEVVWYDNTAGTGSLWSRSTIGACSGAYSVSASDLDGDGDVDVSAVCAGSGTVLWWANNGNGGGWSATAVASGFAAGSSIATGDVDGDGDMDILAAAFSDDDISWFENGDGVGGSWTEVAIATTYSGPLGVDLADVDGDGDLDVLAAAGSAGSVDWFENTNGAGTAWSAASIDAAFASADSVYPADLDEDGDVDLVVAGGTTVAWYENTAGGTSWTATTLASGFTNAAGAWAADLDGDGDYDPIALDAKAGGTVDWFENDTIHHSSLIDMQTTVTALANARGVAVGDIDGDGDADIAEATAAGVLQWSENTTGTGSAWTVQAIATGFGDVVDLALIDVDRDGTLDLVAASLDLGDVAWWSNNVGDGSSWTKVSIDISFLGANSVAFGDMNGDGTVDILSAASSEDDLAWFDNTDGDGNAWTERTIDGSLDGAADIAVGDLDGDGDLDVAAAAITDAQIVIYTNTSGNGTAFNTIVLKSGATGANSVDVVDVDGDGDLDVIAGIGTTDDVLWFANDGGAGTWTEHNVDLSFDGARAVRGVDFDGDGDMDIVAAGIDGNEVAWWESNGAPSPLWTKHTIVAGFSGAYGIAIGDLNGDGTADVVGTARTSGTVAWWADDRAQYTTSTTDIAPATPVPPSTLAAALVVAPEHLGRFGDNAAEVAAIGIRFENGAGVALTTAQASGVFSDVHVYFDANTNDTFDSGTDVLMASSGALVLAAGEMVITLPDGNASLDFGLISPPSFLVVPETSATSGSPLIPNVRVVHVPLATVVEDDDFDSVLVARTTPEVFATLAIDQPPTADAGPAAGSYSIAEGSPLTMDGSGSSDAETALVEWAWDCDDNGSYETVSATAGGATCTFVDDGILIVGLRVTDGTGQTDTASGAVTVSNVAPTVSSTPGTTATEAVEYTYAPTATDPGSADTFTWTLGVGSPATMGIVAGTGVVSWTPVYADAGANSATIEVTDDDGGASSQTWTITVTAADVDGDGMADGWEIDNGLDPTVDDSTLDPDADGVSNLDEYLGGTDPNVYDGPGVPTLVAPIGGAEVVTAVPTLSWTNATDPQGDTLTYDVEVYEDTSMATLLESTSGVVEGVGTSAFTMTVALAEGLDPAWRARAADGNVAGGWSNLETFFVNTFNEAPGVPTQTDPIGGQSVGDLRPSLYWAEAVDPDRDTLTYDVRVQDEGLTTIIAEETGIVPSGGVAEWALSLDLTEDEIYAWEVRAVDEDGLAGDWADPETFFVNTVNQSPGDINFTAPSPGAEIEEQDPTLSCTETNDPENEVVTYAFDLSLSASFDVDGPSADIEHTDTGEASWSLSDDGVTLDENLTWYARVRAEDELGAASSWDEISFFVRGPNDPPAVPVLVGPEDGADAGGAVFVAAHAEDPEGDDVTYEFVVAADEELTDPVGGEADIAPGAGSQGTADQTSWEADLALSGTVFWSARAVDDRGAASDWAPARELRAGRSVLLEEPGAVEEGCRLSVAAPAASILWPLALLFVLVRRRSD